MASAIRSDDPVVFFEHKGLFASKGEAAPPEHVVPLGEARVAREGSDVTVVALAATVPLALAAAAELDGEGISLEVIDLRCLIPLDMATVFASLEKTSRLIVVEENPYQGGWGATVASIVADEGFEMLDAPVRRLAGENVPLPFADALEQRVIPTVGQARRGGPPPRVVLNREAPTVRTVRSIRKGSAPWARSSSRAAPSSRWTRTSGTGPPATS